MTLLSAGKHASRAYGMCLLEYAAFLAGEPHSDAPQCVEPFLAGLGRSLNDHVSPSHRQLLEPLASNLLHTRGDGLHDQRQYMAFDWVARWYMPALLDFANRPELSRLLRERTIIDSPARAHVEELLLDSRVISDALDVPGFLFSRQSNNPLFKPTPGDCVANHVQLDMCSTMQAIAFYVNWSLSRSVTDRNAYVISDMVSFIQTRGAVMNQALKEFRDKIDLAAIELFKSLVNLKADQPAVEPQVAFGLAR